MSQSAPIPEPEAERLARLAEAQRRQAEHLAERVAANRIEAARFREEFGDPYEALSDWVRRTFTVEGLFADEIADGSLVLEDLFASLDTQRTALFAENQRDQAERLERLVAAHKVEAARLREELGDPLEALFTFVRERMPGLALIDAATVDRWESDDPWSVGESSAR